MQNPTPFLRQSENQNNGVINGYISIPNIAQELVKQSSQLQLQLGMRKSLAANWVLGIPPVP